MNTEEVVQVAAIVALIAAAGFFVQRGCIWLDRWRSERHVFRVDAEELRNTQGEFMHDVDSLLAELTNEERAALKSMCEQFAREDRATRNGKEK